MLLINYEINLVLSWSSNCIIVNSAVGTGAPLPIADKKLYVRVITLSNQYNAKLLQRIVK